MLSILGLVCIVGILCAFLLAYPSMGVALCCLVGLDVLLRRASR